MKALVGAVSRVNPPARVGQCGTCRFWEKYTGFRDGSWVFPDGTSAAEREEMLNREAVVYGVCRGVPFGEELDISQPPLAYTIDASYYVADLRTRASFGCVLWERRGTDPQTDLTSGADLAELPAADSVL